MSACSRGFRGRTSADVNHVPAFIKRVRIPPRLGRHNAFKMKNKMEIKIEK
jgi:hypothetical protein